MIKITKHIIEEVEGLFESNEEFSVYITLKNGYEYRLDFYGQFKGYKIHENNSWYYLNGAEKITPQEYLTQMWLNRTVEDITAYYKVKPNYKLIPI